MRHPLLSLGLVCGVLPSACTADDVAVGSDGDLETGSMPIATSSTTRSTTVEPDSTRGGSDDTGASESTSRSDGAASSSGGSSSGGSSSGGSSSGGSSSGGSSSGGSSSGGSSSGGSSSGGSSSGSDGSSEGSASSSTGGPTALCSTPNAAIGPEFGAVTLDAIDVAPGAGFVADVNVRLVGTHSYVADMEVSLMHVPTGIVVALADDQCPDAADFDVTFDQSGAPLVCSATPPTMAGVARPLASLDRFTGIADGSGAWALRIRDDSGLDGGTLQTWCLELTRTDDDPEVCGDGIRTAHEACDGDAALACTALGFDNGVAPCDPVTCSRDVGNCGICGNGVADPAEDCDTEELGGAVCADFGNYPEAGAVRCAADCSYELSDCGEACGNDRIGGAELCDTNEINGETCATQGFVGGALDCDGTVCGAYDTSECSDQLTAICSGDLALVIDGSALVTGTATSTATGTIGDVDVFVDIDHTWDADLDLQIRHVDTGTIVDLVFDECAGGNDVRATFNDEATETASCVNPFAIEGNLTPRTPLSALDGLDMASDWELLVEDDFARGDDGILNGFCVYITSARPRAVTAPPRR